MGFTGLARWVNAPTTGLDLINDNIVRNHGGVYRGKWVLSVKSYRSILTQGNSTSPSFGERTMCATTMNENVFVLLDDGSAPNRTEFLAAEEQATRAATQSGDHLSHPVLLHPPHFRTTYITISPPHSLELLLAQLKARWQPTKQITGQSKGQNPLGSGGAQLVIDGNVFAIGSDWLVRAGNVILAGNTVKGMLLEAEYLPLHSMPVQSVDGTSELLSDLLTSLLPRIPDAKTVAVTIPPGQWDEVLYAGDPPLVSDESKVEHLDDGGSNVGDTYVHGLPPLLSKKGDWVGIDRDRRAAFLIMGALKSEGLL